MRFHSAHSSRVAMAVALAVLTAPAFAQQADTAAANDAAADIVVTAQGRAQRLQDVPVAVSVLGGEALEQQGIRSLQDVSQRLGNVKITLGTQVNSINIRGVGSGENPGFEQAVATFSDGVYRSRSRASVAALFDIERLEVLRGPQTTFFGANASAGALSITTRKPSGNFEWNATGLYGVSDGEYNFEAGVSAPLTETLGVRVAGRLSGMNGFVKMATGGHGPNDDSRQARVSLRWQPSSSWTTDFRFDIVRSRIDNANPFQLLDCPAPAGIPSSPACGAIIATQGANLENELDFRSSARPSFQDFDFHEAALTNELDVGAGKLKSVSAYNRMKVRSALNLIPVPFPAVNGTQEGFPISQQERYRFFSQEVRFESNSGGTFEYTLGAYYQYGKLNFGGLSNFYFAPFGAIIENALRVDFPDITPTTPYASGYGSVQTENTFSAFAAATIRPVDHLRINLGARYTSVRKKATRLLTVGTSQNGDPSTYVVFGNGTAPSATIGVPITRSQGFCAIIGCELNDFNPRKKTDDQFMPSVGVQYDFADRLMGYATYSKGFKAGGYSASSSASVFGPEKVDAYEIGLKGSAAGNMLTYNLAIFRMNYTGLQETTFDVNAASRVSNVAGARSQGVELGTALRLSSYLRLDADIAYLNSKYTDYPNAECTKLQIAGTPPGFPCVQNLSGSRRAYAPKWSGSVGAEVTVPVSADYQVRANPVVAFSSGFFMTATSDPLLYQSRYAKVDLRVAFSPVAGPWELAVVGRNLTNRATASYRLGIPGANGSTLALVERARSVGIQFSIRN